MPDNLCCNICGKDDREDELLVCDGCIKGFHTTCIGLPAVPDEERWQCSACQAVAVAHPQALGATSADRFAADDIDNEALLALEIPIRGSAPARAGADDSAANDGVSEDDIDAQLEIEAQIEAEREAEAAQERWEQTATGEAQEYRTDADAAAGRTEDGGSMWTASRQKRCRSVLLDDDDDDVQQSLRRRAEELDEHVLHGDELMVCTRTHHTGWAYLPCHKFSL